MYTNECLFIDCIYIACALFIFTIATLFLFNLIQIVAGGSDVLA